MTIQDQISIDIKDAMREKNIDRLAALRAVKSAIMLEATKEGVSAISDIVSLKLITKLVKQRKVSAAIYIEQDRKDLADEEINQLSFLEVYLPEQISEDKVMEKVREVISRVGAKSHTDIGRCMSVLIVELKGEASGALILKLVKRMLS